ncbi:MAG TPA: NAD(P)-binding domain-containing protein, partial [Terriglobales bacterium]|nr:NAD(P)-binding domain-containing protein [Terriglobales bacterium]
MRKPPAIAIVGAGSLASALGRGLRQAGYAIAEVVVRNRPASLARGKALARKLGARLAPLGEPLEAKLIWLCV